MENANNTTIGILYPGDMGSSFGKLLCAGGFRVVTTLEGRSPRTHGLCRAAGLNVLASAGDVVEQSDVVISLVMPSAALKVARQVAALAKSSGRGPLYVDANNIPPTAVDEIAEVLRQGEIDFVDAAIHGVAAQLRELGILYLSGFRAGELSSLFGPLMCVKTVGSVPGQASALKTIMSGMSKGLVGLFVETMLLARQLRLLPDALESCEQCYPGVMEAVRRMLPTYPQHALRRSEEMRELEQTMLLNGSTPRVVSSEREVIADLATLEWTKGRSAKQWTVAEIIEEVYRGAARQESEEVSAAHLDGAA
jgi:3-hydroxyisobutyrate dehydrogenase-like beta-hydroxyacid dehydrogenase